MKFYSIKIVQLTFNRDVTFVSKSSGLETPAKEGGRTELELADVNNDGHLDVICVGDHGSPYINSPQHGIMVWLGDGIDSWSVIQVGNFGYGGIEAGDLNLDGYLDVVWGIHHDYGSGGFGDTLIGAALGDGTASNWTPWATGLGTGGETYGMFATDLADFDCNGLLDIISLSFGSGNGYHQYENLGDGTWTQTWSLSGGNANYNIETCDINADGYPDFVGTREYTYVFLGDGAFGFTMNQNGLPSSSYNGIDCGDFDYDGCDDIVIGYGSNGVCCYSFDKINNQWVLKSNGLPTTGYYYAQFGDINGDGFLDIIAYDSPIGYAYLGDGTGNWVVDGTFTMPSPGDYSAFVVDGDFDHDGREDVLIQAEQGSWPSYQNQLKAFSPWLEPTELSALVQIPHGGETFRSGSIRNIRWLSAVPSSQGDATVEIQVSLDGESGPWDTIASDIPNNGCFQWLVDAGGSEYCRIKVIVTTSSSASAISASDFTIIGFNVDAHGPYQGSIGGPVQFTGSAENGTPPYDYYWEFGDGDASNEQNPTHIYDDAGNFTVNLTVTDDDGITVRDSTWALILGDNNPPSTPIIDGLTSGKPGVEYEYTFVSTDDDNDELYYLIDWGDGIEDETSVFPSGVEAHANHTWTNKGTYIIKAKAKDSYMAESEWGTLEVTMPKNQNMWFLHWLERFPILQMILDVLRLNN
ncbi:PDK repeat-containing protein [Thermoplasmatales archaeon SCGC AB-540-F20]|nr:PDK repeat-containing protein [Thermoplasmatales archaeon SCGC AB-540-F20]